MVTVINFGKISVPISLTYFFCSLLSFFSFVYSHYVYVTLYIIVSEFMDFCSLFCSSLCILVLEGSLDISSNSVILSSHISIVLMCPHPHPAKGMIHFCAFGFFGFFVFLIFLKNLFILAVLGLCCCTRAFFICGERGLLFIAAHGFLTVVASLVAEHGL